MGVMPATHGVLLRDELAEFIVPRDRRAATTAPDQTTTLPGARSHQCGPSSSWRWGVSSGRLCRSEMGALWWSLDGGTRTS